MKEHLKKLSLYVLLSVSLVLTIFLTITIVGMKRTIEELDNKLITLQGSVYQINDDVKATLSSATYNMEETLRKQNSLVTEAKYSFGEIKEGKLPLQLQVTPKSYQKMQQAKFAIEGNGTRFELDARYDGFHYVATADVPLLEECEVYLQSSNGDTISNEKLFDIYPLDEVSLDIDVDFEQRTTSISSAGELELEDFIRASVFEDTIGQKPVNILSCDAVLTVNGEEVVRDALTPNEHTREYTLLFKNNLQVKDGDIVSVAVEIKDSNNLVYTYPCDVFTIKNNMSDFDYVDVPSEIIRYAG